MVVYTEQGETLLLRRTGNAFWQSITGGMQWPCEEPETAARREVLEETGIAAAEGWCDHQISRRFHILPEYRYCYGPGVTENVEHFFSLRIPRRCPVQVNPAEHDLSRWEPLPAAADSVWSWTNRVALAQIAQELV